MNGGLDDHWRAKPESNSRVVAKGTTIDIETGLPKSQQQDNLLTSDARKGKP